MFLCLHGLPENELEERDRILSNPSLNNLFMKLFHWRDQILGSHYLPFVIAKDPGISPHETSAIT